LYIGQTEFLATDPEVGLVITLNPFVRLLPEMLERRGVRHFSWWSPTYRFANRCELLLPAVAQVMHEIRDFRAIV
jgi:hypothetical protein